MIPPVIVALLLFVPNLFRAHASLCFENLALRHQLAVYQQTVRRPQLRTADRLFCTWLSRLWSGWQTALAFVQAHTVIAWQQRRFRDHRRRLSQRGTPDRPAIAKDVRDLIRQMWRANPTWGSPRIIGELRKLGIEGRQVDGQKYRGRSRTRPSPGWHTFLKHHVKDVVACDFFTVPTVRFRVLFVLVILAHER
jgi:putative transposase